MLDKLTIARSIFYGAARESDKMCAEIATLIPQNYSYGCLFCWIKSSLSVLGAELNWTYEPSSYKNCFSYSCANLLVIMQEGSLGLNPRSSKQTPKNWKIPNPNDTKEDPIRTKKKQKWWWKKFQNETATPTKWETRDFSHP